MSCLDCQSTLPQEHHLKPMREQCFENRGGYFSTSTARRLVMRVWMILGVVVLAANVLVAQTFRGTILGTVTDASGAVVSGAQVTVRNANTGLERTTRTSADGSYSVPELPIGTYAVTVSQSGFQTSSTTNVAVDVAAERRVDVALKTGEAVTVVEVSGETLPQVETTTDTLG